MSAEVINEIQDAIVWTVHGINWHLEVPLDEFNSQFDNATQAAEAASIALYIFKGEQGNKLSPIADSERGLFIVMDNNDPDPLLGPVMIVHKRGTDPVKGYAPFTSEILANCGFWEDARYMSALLQSELAEINAEEEKDAATHERAIEQVKNLNKNLTLKNKGLDKPESPL